MFKKSSELLVQDDIKNNRIVSLESQSKDNLSEKIKTGKKTYTAPSLLSVEEWCEEPYKDLSGHKSILEFQKWLNDFEDHNSFQDKKFFHDPVKKRDFINQGERLAKDRANIFVRLMRGDPKKALEMAISQTQKNKLPHTIAQHVENWVSTHADIKTMHICLDPRNPMGQKKRIATFDGQEVEAHFYGKRKFLKSTDGLAVWGIFLNKNAAFSESPLLVNLISSSSEDKYQVFLGDVELKIPTMEGVLALHRRVAEAENISARTGRVNYPLVASSDGTLNLIELRYSVVSTLGTWKQAQKLALDQNATLVNINSEFENNIVYNLLKDAEAIGLYPKSESNNSVQYAWIGASDNSEINGSTYNREANITSSIVLNASEGNWKWQDGVDIGDSSFSKWKNNSEPNSTQFPNQDYAAIDFNATDSNGSFWIDLNESYRLPFVIEKPTEPEVKPLNSINGKRKVLLIPARFRDEGNNFDGSSSNPTDQFGNPINNSGSIDTFEPDTRENMINSMKGVKDFFLRNSDGTFELDYVISPTVTLDIPKYEKVAYANPLTPPQPPNLFDSTGLYFEQKENRFSPDPELGYFGLTALSNAALVSPQYNFYGSAFEGILSVQIKTKPGPFAKPPLVTFTGGNLNGGISDPDFVPAQGEAILDALGYVSEIKIKETGAFYYAVPTITLDGVAYSTNYFSVEKGRTVVSWVVTTTYSFGAAGVGYVGMPGSYVRAPISAGVVIHELGHNFGLWHANRHEGEGIRANTDDRTAVDYGNPYSVMGTGGAAGDFTISSKVFLNEVGSFGYKGGNIKLSTQFLTTIVVVADLSSASEVNGSLLKEQDAVNPNTFRIYRHDHGSAPYSLAVNEFNLEIPSLSLPYNLNSLLSDKNLSLSIGGPGEGGVGHIELGGDLGHKLVITKSGKGYSEEPTILVLNDLNGSLLNIDPSWIKRKAGTNYYETVSVRNLSTAGYRGLRGVEIPASQYNPNGVDAGSAMGSYWISYRKSASEYGLSVVNATKRSPITTENTLLDMSPATQGKVNLEYKPKADFDDAFLMLGSTFSDYESDSHITPIKKAGIAPMDYIEVVVNLGTVASGEAKAPKFNLSVSNMTPFTNEAVEISVLPTDSNISAYAYSWYINEVGFSEPGYLNNISISRKFSNPGYQVVKVIVSDMKGGISSRNITINVQGTKKNQRSIVSGNVKSATGPIQGAKVVIKKSEIIEHSVRVSGRIEDSRWNTSHGNPLQFIIDNEKDKQIIMHRGETHRFVFESSANNYPLSFLQNPDHESAKVRLNLLFNPIVETSGGGYTKPPMVDLNETSRFDSNYSQTITTLDLFRDHQKNNTPFSSLGTLISKPSAKILLSDTNVSRVIVRPVKVDEFTGVPLNFGGRGMDRDFPPGLQILRSSYWENFQTETNATATPYIDGVGTIHQDDNGSGYPMVPDIAVFGAGQEANYTAAIRSTDSEKDPSWKKNKVLDRVATVNQGFGYDPNSTLAVALYPNAPFAYWSFNDEESMYETGTGQFLASTSGFNLPIKNGLIAYWRMDEENSTTIPGTTFTIDDNSSAKNDITFVTGPNIRRSYWGTKKGSLKFTSTDNITVPSNLLTTNFSLSMWLQPTATPFNMGFTAKGLLIDINNIKTEISSSPVSTTRALNIGAWSHLLVTFASNSASLYLNGELIGTNAFSGVGSNFIIRTGVSNILLDEVMIYNRALSLTEIRHLAGNAFLDLSGNKYNAVGMGTGFDMVSSAANSGTITNSFSTELGNAVSFDGSTRYLDLSPHATAFSSLDSGTISFWLNPNSGNGPILSIGNKDENKSYCRLSLRNTNQLKFEVLNDGTEGLSVLSKGGGTAIKSNQWSHIVVLVGDSGLSFYVNGKSVPVIIPPDGSNRRAFFTDVEDINYFAIGRHEDNSTPGPYIEYFSGYLDEMQIYERELNNSEIQYLYNLGDKTDVVRARLRPVVDAVGSVVMTEHGRGYKETPDINFTVAHYINNPSYPYFVSPAGEAELNASSVDQIYLTKDFDSSVNLILPDGREVLRMSTEYVMRNDNNQSKAVVPVGLFGYSSPPTISIEGSPNYPKDLNATGYPMFFLDVNESVEIFESGMGYDLTTGSGFATNAVRIFGEGYRPPKFEARINQGGVDALVLTGPGGGNYDKKPSSSNIYFLGEGDETDPLFVNGNNPFETAQDSNEYRRNSDKEDKKNGNYEVITGVKLNQDSRKRGTGWTAPPTVFADWGDETWAGHVGVSQLEFNSSISNIKIQNAGFGYLMPVEISVVDGKPSLDAQYQEDLNNSFMDFNVSNRTYKEAEFEIGLIDENGTIKQLIITNMGSGYMETPGGIVALNKALGNPRINVTGGGGRGAEIYGIVDANGSITNYQIVNGGVGYFNINKQNTPNYTLYTADGRSISSSEQNASLHVSLGASLLEPNISSGKFKYVSADEPFEAKSVAKNIRYAAPWVMILDKGRAEKDITESQRAHATAKVVDGNITKIIVTDGGEGYVDPHVIICGTSPKYGPLNDGKGENAWQWRCNNLRETVDGKFLRCGHVDISNNEYPPETCPGESDINSSRTDFKWNDFFTDWNRGHGNKHKYCPTDSNHRQNVFLSPHCSGKKANFVLINDYYRAGISDRLDETNRTSYTSRPFDSKFTGTYEDWLPFETNCTVTAKNGEIREIFINSYGSKYHAPEFIIDGSGGGTDPIPVFHEEGYLTRIFYNDPRIKNLEIDRVDFPIGAGQGFSQKPWGKDDQYEPTYGVNEAILCHVYADFIYWDGVGKDIDSNDIILSTGRNFPEIEVHDFNQTFSAGVKVRDAYGDRVSNIQILDPGLYALGDFNITIDYNQTCVPDRDFNGASDFVQATAIVETTNILAHFELDHNGTFLENNFLLPAGNRETLWRSTFLAEPDVTILDKLGSTTYSKFKSESNVSDIILGGVTSYSPNSNESYLDIVVDDRLPNKFFYGLKDSNRSAMGGEILVYDGMPGMNWGSKNDWDTFALTDEYGNYAVPNLTPGMYNIAVLMEDEYLQDLALRPDTDDTLFSRTLYVPGFTQVFLETDNRGTGRSRLVWSSTSRQEARFYRTNSLKELGGLGGGFSLGQTVNLNIEAHSSNTSLGIPNIVPQIEIDGSISLFIVDDVNSSVFDPNDRFSVSYASAISGIDFTNKYEKTFIDSSYFGGSKSAIESKIENNQTISLFLSPSAGASPNSIEMPIASESNPAVFKTFSLNAYDQNGSPLDCSSAKWTLSFDFNVTDGNYSKIASLSSPLYYMYGTPTPGSGTGYYYPLFLNTIYQDINGSGIYNPIDFTAIAVHNHKFNGDLFYMDGSLNNAHAVSTIPSNLGLIKPPNDGNKTSQVNLSLYSTLQGGGMTLTATLNGQSVSTRITHSKLSTLTEEELWLDQYFSTILKKTISSLDEDSDGLTLDKEWENRTNPLQSDTDGDGLNDFYEINDSNTNPRSSDTDGDGFLDSTELLPELLLAGLNPLIYNTVYPAATIHPHNSNGPDLNATAGSNIIIGAEANETSLTGNKVPLIVTIEGNFTQVVTQSNNEWKVDSNATPGVYFITYRAVDSLKRAVTLTHKLTVTQKDTTSPVISLSISGPPYKLYTLKGTNFSLPSVTALDDQDLSVNGSMVTVVGKDMVDVNKTGTYQVNYSVSDTSGNTANLTLSVIVEDFAFTLKGKAIDGYLSGSTVIFDGKADAGGFDGLHDLDRVIQTDGSGSFSLQLTQSELEIFDLDKNGQLDANEGQIIVVGGYDPTIQSNFVGRYKSDINSSVVSPLTTLIAAVMDQGISKNEAKSKVSLALGLPAGIDPTNYDPIAEALAGKSTSGAFLLATARLANAMKQADALANYLSIPTTNAGQVSTAFISQLATSISGSLISFNPLDDTNLLNRAFSSSLQSVQPTADVTQVSSAVALLESSDDLLVQTINAGGAPNVLAVSLAKNQQAVESTIITGYSDPSLANLSTLASSTSTESIKSISNAISSINVFPPVSQDFTSNIRSDSWSVGSLIVSIEASDGDGDTILYTITSTNFDLDADGNPPFAISSTGSLTINDIDDLLPSAGKTIKINLSLSDGKGMVSNIVGALSIDNKLSLDSTAIAGKLGWYESSWLKTFYSAGASWIYHPSHNWLYVSPDSLDGYWFWDSGMSIWWWTKPSVYPYFYRSNSIWNYWNFNGSSRVYYNYQTKQWVTP